MSRLASEVLKTDGKPKMTLCDGLRINRCDTPASLSRRGKVRSGRGEASGRLWDQPTRIADAPARVPGMCLAVVTAAKMTAIASTIEKAAKTKRGAITRAPLPEPICSTYRGRFGSPRSLARDGSVQDVLVPFVNFDDGGAHRGDDSNQQSYRASQTGPRIDVASQWDEALKSWNQDRNASKGWAMRMPALRTTKNAVMASNMQVPVRPSSVKGSAHGVKNNSIEWRMSALS
jgi:hypothetical protein